jgi:hypothetical protein|tara:strand:+ start:533 stop:850 length:318 start_codon:yes stop_codon:yes gene_type:complete
MSVLHFISDKNPDFWVARQIDDDCPKTQMTLKLIKKITQKNLHVDAISVSDWDLSDVKNIHRRIVLFIQDKNVEVGRLTFQQRRLGGAGELEASDEFLKERLGWQ